MIKVFCYKHNRSKQHWAVCSVYTSDSYFSVSKCPKGYRLFKQIIQRSHSNTTLTTVLIPCCQCHLNVMRHVHIDLILFAALRWWKEIITLKGTFISIFLSFEIHTVQSNTHNTFILFCNSLNSCSFILQSLWQGLCYAFLQTWPGFILKYSRPHDKI